MSVNNIIISCWVESERCHFQKHSGKLGKDLHKTDILGGMAVVQCIYSCCFLLVLIFNTAVLYIQVNAPKKFDTGTSSGSLVLQL